MGLWLLIFSVRSSLANLIAGMLTGLQYHLKIEYSPFLGSFWSFWKKFSDLEERKSLRILRVIFIFRLTFLSQFQFHFLFYFHYKDNFCIEKHYSVIKIYRHKFNQGFHGIFVLVHFVIIVVENNNDEKYIRRVVESRRRSMMARRRMT